MEFISPWLNVPDACVLVVLVLGILGGIRRGFSGELIRLITIVIAIGVGWHMSDQASAWLAARTGWPDEELKAVAFFGVIISVYTILSVIRHSFRLFLDFSFKGKLEIIGGAFLGLLRATVFSLVVLLGATMIASDVITPALEGSRSGRFVIEHVRPLYDEWAEKNPEFKLPDLEKAKERGLDTPAWEEYLGPLIAPDKE